MIQASIDSVATVDKALQFGFTPVSIQPPKEMPDSESLEEQAQGLYGQLCHEIRTMARTAFDASYVGKQSVTRKALRPINAIREKLVALAFLDQQIPPVIHSIDDTLNQLPLSGPLEGPYLNLLAGLLSRQLMSMGLPVAQQIEEEETFALVDPDEEINIPLAALAAIHETRVPATALQWDF